VSAISVGAGVARIPFDEATRAVTTKNSKCVENSGVFGYTDARPGRWLGRRLRPRRPGSDGSPNRTTSAGYFRGGEPLAGSTQESALTCVWRITDFPRISNSPHTPQRGRRAPARRQPDTGRGIAQGRNRDKRAASTSGAMKRRDLLRHLERHGCVLLREGSGHTV